MHVEVDENCIGCGLCVELCPEVFEMNDQDLAVVKISEVPDEHADACREAEEECPSEAIHTNE